MSVALAVARGAVDRAPTFHVHVDPAAGNDSTGSGSKASPYATLTKALTAVSAGQSIGFKAGTTHRLASTVSLSSRLRLGSYGQGAPCILSGSPAISGWSSASSGPELLTDPGFESGLTGWTVEVAGPTVDTTTVHTGAQSVVMNNGTGKFSQAISLTSGVTYTVSLWHKENIAGKQSAIQLLTGTNYLQANGTWSTSAGQTIPLGGSTTWQQFAITFTAPSTGSYTFRIQGYDGGTYTSNIDDASIKTGTGVSAGTYTTTLANTPAYVSYTSGSTTTGLTRGSSASALTANQWFYSGTTLSVNLGGTNPSAGTVEAATVQPLNLDTITDVVLRNLEVRHGYDQAVKITNSQRVLIDHCAFRYTAYVNNSGTVLIQNGSTGARVTRSVFDSLQNDGIWIHASQNVQIDHNTISRIGALAGDVQSDGIQAEDTYGTNPNSSGLWIHHNTIDMSATTSPKGCILVNADIGVGAVSGAIVEWNTCLGGNYGIAPHASNVVVRYNACSGQISTFGGNIHVDSAYLLDNIHIYRNLLVGSGRDGLVIQDSGNNRTNFYFVNNTIVNPTRAAIYDGSPISGLIVNNIITWTTPPTLRTLYISSTAGALTVDYNLYRGEFGSFMLLGGTAYSTLAAWAAGTGYDTHSTVANPLLSADGLYTPQTGSPALNAGVAITGVTDGYLGAAPDLGYAEAA